MTTTQAIQRLRDVIRRQHKALSTEESNEFDCAPALRLRLARDRAAQLENQGCGSASAQAVYQGGQGRQGSPRPATRAHGRTDPANGICPGSLATGRSEQDSGDDSGTTGPEISRISMGVALGLAVPLTLSLSPPAHGPNGLLSDVLFQAFGLQPCWMPAPFAGVRCSMLNIRCVGCRSTAPYLSGFASIFPAQLS